MPSCDLPSISHTQLAGLRRAPAVFLASLAVDHGASWTEAIQRAQTLVHAAAAEAGSARAIDHERAADLCAAMRDWALAHPSP